MKSLMLVVVVMSVGLLTSLSTRAEQQAVAQQGPEQKLWLTDFDEALRVAAVKKLPVLVDFTGSDWCGWCIRLDKEVFSQEAFKAYARENLVLVKLDFPRKPLPREQAARNQALADKYKIVGFPTIVLVDAEGRELSRTSYKPGGADAYVKHLKALLD
jgi:protein disulfide-isomerase